MISLLGFWAVVTVLVVLLVIPCITVVYAVLEVAARQAMPEEAASKFCSFFYGRHVTEHKEPSYYHCKDAITKEAYLRAKEERTSYSFETYYSVRDDSVKETRILNKFPVSPILVGNLIFWGIMAWGLYAVAGSVVYGHVAWGLGQEASWLSLVDVVVWVGTKLDVVGGYIAALLLLYTGLVTILKLVYKGSIFVAKVNTHMEDGDKHAGVSE